MAFPAALAVKTIYQLGAIATVVVVLVVAVTVSVVEWAGVSNSAYPALV